MKIHNQQSQPATAQQVEGSQRAKESGAARKKTAAKPEAKGDTVQLSSPVDAELNARQAEQAQRVVTIKELVKSGKYKVDAHAVAEKMVSRKSGE